MMKIRLRLFPAGSNGFGLLEAIVALALFAGAGMALFAWINTSLATAVRLQETEVVTRVTGLATEWLQTINPALHDRGEVLLAEGVRLRWQARPSTPRVPVAPFPGGTSTPFELALFAVEVKVSHPQLTHDLDLTMQRLGVWREPVALLLEP